LTLSVPWLLSRRVAPMAELVDAPDSKSGTARCAGSIPAGGTINLGNSFSFNKLSVLRPWRLPADGKVEREVVIVWKSKAHAELFARRSKSPPGGSNIKRRAYEIV
jgi:hypothetical protein